MERSPNLRDRGHKDQVEEEFEPRGSPCLDSAFRGPDTRCMK